ncbi:hypothetical protein LI82_04115 [Methanococcoides methylutens]|uniref:Uncharacterized protein n=1 Tax=Methanococcoides methylutens TaxID=2226 RepID=A0A099T4U0_METMT|nr:hypothetical protein [Methanococcoides methylutens]KGK99216.1 hypothetical protein LI82_04115 [Methanococcoides methylutens]
MSEEKKDEMLPDILGAYPVGYVPDGALQRGALYRIENNGIRMYPPGTSAYHQGKARKRWEAERMEIYEEHKFEWLTAFLSDTKLPDINDLLKFNHHPASHSTYKQAWLWVYDKFEHDKEIKNKAKSERNVDSVWYLFRETYKRHFP